MTTENTTPENTAPTAEELAAQAAAVKAGLGNPPEPKAPITPKEEQAPAAKGDEVVPIAYNPTGDAGLDMLLESVGSVGLAPDHPAMKAAIDGDFDLLSAELAKREVKGHERLIALGQKAFADIRGKTQAKQAEDLKAVHNEAGGPEQWAEIQKWAAANADEGEQKAISSALGKGGLEARMAAAWLRSNYERASGVSTDGTGKAVSESKGAGQGKEPLSPREYGRAVAEARGGFKGDFENSSVYKDLQARRMAWRG